VLKSLVFRLGRSCRCCFAPDLVLVRCAEAEHGEESAMLRSLIYDKWKLTKRVRRQQSGSLLGRLSERQGETESYLAHLEVWPITPLTVMVFVSLPNLSRIVYFELLFVF